MDVAFSVGTSAMFPYIANPLILARAAGALTVEINPSKTTLSEVVDYHIEAAAADALNQLWERVQ